MEDIRWGGGDRMEGLGWGYQGLGFGFALSLHSRGSGGDEAARHEGS
jgi:hypothetical protein